MATLCPECGVDLEKKNRKTHAYVHYGVKEQDVNKLTEQAQRRYREILGASKVV